MAGWTASFETQSWSEFSSSEWNHLHFHACPPWFKLKGKVLCGSTFSNTFLKWGLWGKPWGAELSQPPVAAVPSEFPCLSPGASFENLCTRSFIWQFFHRVISLPIYLAKNVPLFFFFHSSAVHSSAFSFCIRTGCILLRLQIERIWAHKSLLCVSPYFH